LIYYVFAVFQRVFDIKLADITSLFALLRRTSNILEVI